MIKQASEKDIPIIEEILADASNRVLNKKLPSWDKQNIQWKALSIEFSADDFFILYENNSPIACMAIVDYDPLYWSEIKKGQSLFIHKLAVKSDFTGQGFSVSLIDFAKEKAKKLNVPLRLDCNNKCPKLKNFYESQGFRFVGKKTLFDNYTGAFYIYY